MICIHLRPESFSDKWIEYCENHDIAYKLVDCYSSSILDEMKDCDGLMWHWAHHDHRAVLFARQLTVSLEAMGKKVFPSFDTCWHFDDKVGQKYLLEAVAAPLVPSYVFYDQQKAIEWAKNTKYPKVFKLRGGAGSENVRIVESFASAQNLIRQSFCKGFKVKNRANFLKERLWHFKRDKNLATFVDISKGIARLFIPKEAEKQFPRERNYVYFQDFIPNNDYDIRIIVIGDRAFAIKRMVREGDFRASGSGFIVHDPCQIPKECLTLAFDLSCKLNVQCLAYDFIFNNGKPLLVEISYSFARGGYLPCPGYWNEKLNWVEGSFVPEYFMIEDFLRKKDV